MEILKEYAEKMTVDTDGDGNIHGKSVHRYLHSDKRL